MGWGLVKHSTSTPGYLVGVSVFITSPIAFAAAAPPEAWAEVRVGDLLTRYRRRGSGQPIVVVADVDELTAPDARWPRIADAMATRGRTFVPAVPAPVRAAGGDHAAFTDWLFGFLEGLGLEAVTLVAAEPFCAATHAFADAEPDRVTRLVVVASAAGVETGGELPTLVLPPELALADAERRAREFVAA